MKQNAILFTFILFLCTASAYSQVKIAGTDHLNRYLNNPAAISESDGININLRGSQYSGLSFDKYDYGFGSEMLYSPDSSKSSFMAGYSYSNLLTNYSRHSAILGYAYEFELSNDYFLALGISISGETYLDDYTSFTPITPNSFKVKGHLYYTTPGAIFKMKNLKLSVSSMFSFADVVQLDYVNAEDKTINRKPYWYGANGMISYNIKLSPKLSVEPYFRTITYSYYPDNKSNNRESIWFYDFGSLVTIKDFMRAGAGYYFSQEPFNFHYLYIFSTFRVLKFMDVSGICSIPTSTLSYSLPNYSLQLGFEL